MDAGLTIATPVAVWAPAYDVNGHDSLPIK
jgi:hypothetical protein